MTRRLGLGMALLMAVPAFAAGTASRREGDVCRFLNDFGALSEEAWTRLKGTRLLARTDTAPAPGRFPLIVGALRPLSTVITSEFLASHGYGKAHSTLQNPGDRGHATRARRGAWGAAGPAGPF